MKKYVIIIVTLLSFVYTGCNNWLDIRPKLEIYEEVLFEKAGGYYSALNDLYLKMSESSLYGKELSWGAIEAWGGSYDLDALSHKAYNQLLKLQYDQNEVKSLAENIWKGAYKIIAEANNLIHNLEKNQEIYFPYGDTTRNMILGEALACRALMHFELVRIFAKAPIIDGGVSATIPFVDSYPSIINEPKPTKDVLARIIADLERAKQLVKAFDTENGCPGNICYKQGMTLKLESFKKYVIEDEFLTFRGHRLGYYAITQLLARVCLYAGENHKAYSEANEIVTMCFNSNTFFFVTPAQIGNPDLLDFIKPRLHTEITFGTYNSQLSEWTKSYLETTSGSYRLILNDPYYLFDSQDSRKETIRENMITKYSLNGLNMAEMSEAKCIVPVMRFIECYLIAAEALFDEDPELATIIFNDYVLKRGNEFLRVSQNIAKEDFLQKIIDEYRREFIGEGYLIYVYKRLNKPIKRAYGEDIEHNGQLVWPVPDSEAGI